MTDEQKTINNLKTIATEKIDVYGSDVTFKKRTSTYDINQGKVVESFVDTPTKADINAYESDEIKGLIQVGDLKADLKDFGVTISYKDQLVFNGVTYEFINPNPVIKLNTLIFYENAQLRGIG